jgi:hypothetical protein
MFTFSPAESSIYRENKSFCESVIKDFEELNISFSGFCDSYGYQLTAHFIFEGFHFFIEFDKNQSSQGPGFYWNPTSINTISIKVVIKELRNDLVFSFGENWFKKLLYSRNSCNKSRQTIIHSYILENKVEKFTLRNGILKIHFYDVQQLPLIVLNNLKPILKTLS